MGFSEHVGHALTFKLLTCDTKQIIHRSQVRLPKKGEWNLKEDAQCGDTPEQIFLKSKRDDEGDELQLPTINLKNEPFNTDMDQDAENKLTLEEAIESLNDPPETREPPEERTPMDEPALRDLPEPLVEEHNDPEFLSDHVRGYTPGQSTTRKPLALKDQALITTDRTLNKQAPEDCIKKTFLLPEDNDGDRPRAFIIGMVNKLRGQTETDPEKIRFKCRVNIDDDTYEEIVAYNDIADYLEPEDGVDGIWYVRRIIDHKKVKQGSRDYKGSSWNLKIEWETGETTWEPLHTHDRQGIGDISPNMTARYAKQTQPVTRTRLELLQDQSSH